MSAGHAAHMRDVGVAGLPGSTSGPASSGSAGQPGTLGHPGGYRPSAAPPAPVPSDRGSEDPASTIDVTVVLPAYNEVGHVTAEVERITAALKASPYSFEILVVDDGSTDGTGDAVEGRPFVRVLRFPSNRGVGTARRIGSTQARGRAIVWTDADMSYPNEMIPDLVDALHASEADMVVGARTTEQGTMKALRVPAKWFIRRVAEFLSQTRIPDLNSGLRAFDAQRARPYLRLLPTGFSCVSTLTLALLSNGHIVDYLPVPYAPRAGRSHFHPVRDAYRYILQVLRMITLFDPLRVFAPVALTLLFVGAVKAVYDVVTDPVAIAINTLLILITGVVLFSLGLLADLIVRVNRSD